MKISFAGLGQMGKPIAKNLAKAGAEVVATDRKPDAFPDLEATGVQTTTDFARLAEGEIVFLCLPNGQVVHDVLLGENGLAERLRPRASRSQRLSTRRAWRSWTPRSPAWRLAPSTAP